jgi:hypothetical protein
MKQSAAVLVLAVPAFAWIRLSRRQSRVRCERGDVPSLLAPARVPAQPPQLQMGDRGPAIAVAVAMVLIVAFIVVLWVKYG